MADPIVEYLERNLDGYLEDLRFLAGIDSGTYDKAGVDAVQRWFEERFRQPIRHRSEPAGTMGRRPHRQETRTWHRPRVADRSRGYGLSSRHGRRATAHVRRRQNPRPRHVRHEGRAADRPLSDARARSSRLDGLRHDHLLDRVGRRDRQRHSAELLKSEGPKHHAALTLEAARANGDIVTSRKATRWYRVEAHGKAAHAGVEPEKGASATLAIANVIVEAFKLNGRKPGMTLNPGRIIGGANPNIVADSANVIFDLRAWTNAELEELAAGLQEVVTAERVPGVRLELIREGEGMPAMERSPGTIKLESHAVDIAGSLGFSLAGAATGGGSDVSYAVHKGTPGLDGLRPESAGSITGQMSTSSGAASCRGPLCWRSYCRRSAPTGISPMTNRPVDENSLLNRLEADGIEHLWVIYHDYSGRGSAKTIPLESFRSTVRDGVVFAVANLDMTSDDRQAANAKWLGDSGDFMAVPDPRSYAVLPRFPKTAPRTLTPGCAQLTATSGTGVRGLACIRSWRRSPWQGFRCRQRSNQSSTS